MQKRTKYIKDRYTCQLEIIKIWYHAPLPVRSANGHTSGANRSSYLQATNIQVTPISCMRFKRIGSMARNRSIRATVRWRVSSASSRWSYGCTEKALFNIFCFNIGHIVQLSWNRWIIMQMLCVDDLVTYTENCVSEVTSRFLIPASLLNWEVRYLWISFVI